MRGKMVAAVLVGMLLMSVAACGSGSTSSPSTASQTPSTAESPTETQRTYTEDDVNNTITKCAPLSENGADIIDDITSPTKTLSMVSFPALGKGVVSDVFKCAFNSLGIPDKVVQQINTESEGEQETTVGNLNVLWENSGDEISVYMSTESLHQ